ncbi:response regulator [Adhaeribacter terreus]|uniref:Response regulator n=1 Tax=Adhaeribacter terreus TaxID=529703 RepID=A0ABW0EBE9_9BACT
MLNKLLLIDDDDISLMICEIVIKQEKFASEVLKARNGQEGINYLKSLDSGQTDNKKPDLILLDLNMPVMNGWEFLEEFSGELEEKFPEMKVCILTSSVDPFDFSHSKIYDNVIGFISKPLTIEALNELRSNERLEANFRS